MEMSKKIERQNINDTLDIELEDISLYRWRKNKFYKSPKRYEALG